MTTPDPRARCGCGLPATVSVLGWGYCARCGAHVALAGAPDGSYLTDAGRVVFRAYTAARRRHGKSPWQVWYGT